MTVTDNFLRKTQRLNIQPEVTPNEDSFLMFNDAGTEVEVSEFLYGLIRLVKPRLVLETGTHVGISSSYIAQGLKDNGMGRISTFEIIPELRAEAQALWADLSVGDVIDSYLQDAQTFQVPKGEMIDFLFLDSEPDLRFDEFMRFWPSLKPGGFVAIHDLHCHLGHSEQTVNGMYDWPFGDFRNRLGLYIKDFRLQTMAFPNPRGLAFFQKARDDFGATRLLRGEI